jgi:hypothetical protein
MVVERNLRVSRHELQSVRSRPLSQRLHTKDAGKFVVGHLTSYRTNQLSSISTYIKNALISKNLLVG